MTLNSLQLYFQAGILSPLDSDLFQNAVSTLSVNTPQHRLAIYQNNHSINLSKALSEVYPVCERLVGSAFFQAMAKVYIQAHPSIHFSLNHYGEEFSAFIEKFPPTQSLPYLPDMAKLEWEVYQLSFRFFSDGASKQIFDLKSMAELNPEQLAVFRFRLNPELTLIRSNYPIDRIFETNQLDYLGDEEINLEDGGAYLILKFQDYQLNMFTISTEEWTLLKQIEAGKTVQELYHACLGNMTGEQLQKYILTMIQRGFILGPALS